MSKRWRPLFCTLLALWLALQAGAALRVESLDAALREAQQLLAADAHRLAMAQAAQAFSTQHRGAAQRMAEAVLAQLA